MKLSQALKWALGILLASNLITACQSDQQQEQLDEEILQEDTENSAADPEENASADNEASEQSDAQASEENITEDDISEAEVSGENIEEETFSEEDMTNEEAVTLSDETVEENVVDESAGAALSEEESMIEESVTEESVAASDTAEAEAAPVEDMNQSESAQATVYYVMDSFLDLKEQADPASASVGSLAAGDPVLVKINGEWAHVLGRGYVMTASLSSEPVGRSIEPKVWQ